MPDPQPKFDMVRQLALLQAGPLKLACYQVFDPEKAEYGPKQFHMTYNNTVIAVASEQAAKLFCTFVTDFVGRKVTSDCCKLGDFVTGNNFDNYSCQGVVVEIDNLYIILQGEHGFYIVKPDVTVVPDKNLWGSALTHTKNLRDQRGWARPE